MSMQHVPDAVLDGYGSPIYLQAMNAVARAFTARSSIGLSSDKLEQAARAAAQGGIEFIRSEAGGVTSDDYQWFAIIYFRINGGHVAIAIPMACDTSHEDGTRLDRSPAAYERGVSRACVSAEAVALLLAGAMARR